ncbi:GIY-YIG nuclease family protein [Bifidobacterium catenulatum]|jgi:hypothetical protein|nr:GIY-YIG nuclease family protein [Bifidobacterium catenulatum]MDF4086955.1 GIY-YIG nuclease family protein [Bifidobacterium catenulatum]MDF4094266.1 GIY-YIG nuclease family protein [Bifidobacterium catenulatum]
MDSRFAALVEQLPILFERLMSCPIHKFGSTLPVDMPERGVYLFSESGEARYVGRTNRLRSRLREHGSGRHNDAPFAFKLARHATGHLKAKGGLSRIELEADPAFSSAFAKARETVRNMEWRWVQVDDPDTQCLLEIYASIALRTPFNDFENH